MPAGDCIRQQIEEGNLDREFAEELAAFVDQRERDLARFGHADAEARALIEAAETAEFRALNERNRRTMQRLKENEVLSDITAAGDQVARFERAKRHLVLDSRGNNPETQLLSQKEWHKAMAMSTMREAIEPLRSVGGGLVTRRTMNEHVLRELFGESSGDPEAAAIAPGVRAALDYFIGQYRRNGVFVPKIENYVPQRHSTVRTGQASKDEWIDLMEGWADRENMIDRDTGRAFTRDRLREKLGGMYDNITSPTDDSSGILGRLDEERFFKFKDADSYLAWQKRFSDDSTLFDAVIGYVEQQATRLAQIEKFGPNPRRTLNKVEDAIGRASGGQPFSRQISPSVTRIYDQITGAATGNVTGVPSRTTRSLAGLRMITNANILGSAVFSAVADSAFLANNLRALGVNNAFFRQLGGTVRRLFDPRKKADRERAARYGYVAESALSRSSGAARFDFGDALAERSRRVMDAVLRGTGLTAVTDNARRTNYDAMLAFLGNNRGLRFDQLQPRTQRWLEQFNIRADDWDEIRRAPLEDMGGGDTVLNPLRVEGQAGRKLNGMLHRMLEAGSPLTDPTTRAFLTFGTAPDKLEGQIVRMLTQLTLWPTAILRNQREILGGTRAASDTMTAFRFGALTFIQATAIAAVAQQLRDVASGREPRDFSDQRLWQDALIRGGTMGILGDLIYRGSGRGGPGLAEALAGPTVSLLGQGARLTVGNLQDLAEGERTNFGREGVRFLEQLIPGKTAWFAQLALERLVFDEVQKMVDPRASESFAAQMRAAERRNQDFFARPGGGLELEDFEDLIE